MQMTKCVACEAYPGHTGTHYSINELTTLFYNHRRHASTNINSMTLPGTVTHGGEPLVCMHAPDHPDARFVDGIWLIEASTPLVERRFVTRTPVAQEAGPAKVPISCSLSARVPLGSDAAERPEWAAAQRAASAGPVAPSLGLRVLWAKNGQAVDIRAVMGAATKHAAQGLKTALRDLEAQEGVKVECLINRRAGEVRVRMNADPGQEGKLLMASGRVVDSLGQGHRWDKLELVTPS